LFVGQLTHFVPGMEVVNTVEKRKAQKGS